MLPFQRKDRAGWWIRYRNAEGRWVTRKGGETEGDAYAALERATFKARAIREGLIDGRQAAVIEASRRAIADVIADFELYLQDKGSTAAHVSESVRCIKAVVSGAGIRCLADVEPRLVERWLGGLRRDGRSARTRNVYLTRMRALMNWAMRRGMVEANRLDVIEAAREHLDKREVSRALSPDEVERLLAATPCTTRRLYYRFAVRTGLRWSEIKRLDWSCITVGAEGASWVTLAAADTKSRRSDRLPLSSDLVKGLIEEGPRSSGPIFAKMPMRRTLKRDLERAGIEYENERGQVDRKSLRKTFGTHLAIAGVDLQVAVRLMRHRDPRLTLNVYTDPMLLDLQSAVASLPAGSGSAGDGVHNAHV